MIEFLWPYACRGNYAPARQFVDNDKVMEKEQVLETELNSHTVAEPHFDEDWTVLSARPVVPIEELKTKASRRKVLKFFGAFLVASFLGAVVALVAIRLRESASRPAGDAEIGEEYEAAPIENAAVPSENIDPANETAAVPEAEVKTVVAGPRKSERAIKRVEKPVLNSDEVAPDQPLAGTSQDSSQPRPRLIDQWEERRARRVIRRQRRERGAHHSRDLMRIDEIFEGSQPEP